MRIHVTVSEGVMGWSWRGILESTDVTTDVFRFDAVETNHMKCNEMKEGCLVILISDREVLEVETVTQRLKDEHPCVQDAQLNQNNESRHNKHLPHRALENYKC
jgi:hypothetical protein